MNNSARMILMLAVLFTAWSVSISIPAAQKQLSAEVALKNAMEKETMDGDLRAAMEQYKKVIATRGASRAVVAKAMLQLGGCYEKQGSADARKTFEQLIKDFADQSDIAAQARARLTALAAGTASQVSGSGIRLRQVWAGQEVTNEIAPSPDGSFLAYIKRANGETDLILRDVAAGSERRLANLARRDEAAYDLRWSPDGKGVIYIWSPREGKDEEIRLYDLSTNTSRALFVDDSLGGIRSSRDPKSLLIIRYVSSYYSLGVVSLQTRKFGEIKKFDPPWPSFYDLSPDGKYVAYAASIRQGTANDDLFVIDAVTGKESCHLEHPAAESLLGWTPDGRNLLFQSDRTGSPDIWAQPMENGKPTSHAVLVKSFGEWVQPMGFTAGGTFFYYVTQGGSDLYLTELDPESGHASEPQKLIKNHEGSNYGCAFSPDGRNLAYLSFRGILGPSTPAYLRTSDTVCLYSMDTREQREYPIGLPISYYSLRWSGDSQYLGFTVYDVQKRKYSLDRLDTNSGNLIKVSEQIPGTNAFLSLNGNAVFLNYTNAADYNRSHMVRRDLQTGVDRDLFPELHPQPWHVSPDEKYIGYALADRSPEGKLRYTVGVASIEEGTKRILINREDMSLSVHSWTPDGRKLILLALVSSLPTPLWDIWLLPIEAGTPQKLGLSKRIVKVAAHPDGKRFAFTVRADVARQIWAIDNLLPPAKDAKPNR